MSKAEEKALKEYPQNIVTDYNGSHDLNYYKRVLYQQGYHQAEKDLELTWEDIRKIISIDQQVCGAMGISAYVQNHQQVMKEVLKRFRDYKK